MLAGCAGAWSRWLALPTWRPLRSVASLPQQTTRYGNTRWAIFKASFQRELTLMGRNRFLYGFRTGQVHSFLQLLAHEYAPPIPCHGCARHKSSPALAASLIDQSAACL